MLVQIRARRREELMPKANIQTSLQSRISTSSFVHIYYYLLDAVPVLILVVRREGEARTTEQDQAALLSSSDDLDVCHTDGCELSL